MGLASMCIDSLLQRHPWAVEVFDWHGVQLDEVDPTLSLGALCWLNKLDSQRLLHDLIAADPDPQWGIRYSDDWSDRNLRRVDEDEVDPELNESEPTWRPSLWEDFVDYDLEQGWSK